MKNYSLLLILAFLVFSCGGEDSPKETTNSAPEVPNLLYPTNSLLCTSNNLTFEWDTAIDLDGDAVSYKIEIASNNEFTTLVQSGTISQTSKTFELEKGKAYYWRLQSIDTKDNSSSFSQTWSFYTEGEAEENHLPFMPELIAPLRGDLLTTNSTELEWSCSDLDNDVLTFTVYLGTNATLEQVATVNTTNYTANLLANTNYYWRVDVTDTHNSKTVGQIWSFQTE